MQIKAVGLPRSRYLERGKVELSREAHQRLQGFDHYQAQGRNAAFTCRYFGISRQTFYRWKQRYDPEALSTLEDRSPRPHRRRHPTWTHVYHMTHQDAAAIVAYLRSLKNAAGE